ncbi:MAG: sulfotransferase [Mariprofundus sp.]
MAKPIKLSNNKKRKIEQLLGLAGRALQQGDAFECVATCDAIEAISPAYPDSLHVRGLLALQQGDLEQALQYLQQAVTLAPKRADIMASLGNAQVQAGDMDAAMACYQQALSIDATDMATHLGLAAARMVQEQYFEAITVLERAKKRKPGDADVRMGLFQACHAVNRYDEARSHLEAILARDGGHAEAHYGLSILAVEQGAMEMARPHLYHALQINPFHVDAWSVLADLSRYDEENEETVAMLHVYQHCPEGSEARMKMAFALAKVRDDLGAYTEAFTLLDEANAIRHGQSTFDTPAAVAALAEVVAKSTASLLADGAQTPHTPCLFVLGMPRSGSTLAEQILASHPQVKALGENGHLALAIRDVAGDVKSPAALNSLSTEQCEAIGEQYMQRVEQAAGPARCYCDKTLSHISLVGLIHRALPQARFVHMRRNPLDAALSIYKNNLQGSHFAYGYDLSELGQYYAAYQRLMAHWASVLSAEQFYQMDYEQLVTSQEPQTRALLAACGLDWNPACLDFQQAGHAVQTASAVQVRKPLSANSIGLWKHYRQQLAPLQSLCPPDADRIRQAIQNP